MATDAQAPERARKVRPNVTSSIQDPVPVAPALDGEATTVDPAVDSSATAPAPAAEAGTETADSTPTMRRWALVLYQGQIGKHLSMSHELTTDIRNMMRTQVDTPKETTEIDVWLDTPGGDAHAAYKLGLLLRAHAHRIRIVIPDYAKSAGTLLALVGDEIYMDPIAELGPLDAQLTYEQEAFQQISALDRARSLDDLVNTGMSIAVQGGAQVLQSTRLSRAESLTAMLDFSAKFMAPLVGKLDPTVVHWSNTLLQVAVRYGQRLLASRIEGIAGLGQVPAALVERYPTHGFVISADEARSLGLPVRDISEYDFADRAVGLHMRHEVTHETIVEIFDLDLTLNPPSADPEEHDHV